METLISERDTVNEVDSQRHFQRNPIHSLDLDTVLNVRVNAPATRQRAASLGARRTVKKAWQVAWDLQAISCIDLTTLAGDDTPGRVRRLCAKARHPVRSDLSSALSIADLNLTVGGVCVYPMMVSTAVKNLEGAGIPVASVAAGFPAGQTPLPQRLAEIEYSVNEGAEEIDIVISRELVLLGKWKTLHEEISQMRSACGDAHLKVILATGELKTLANIYRASRVAMMAGADFIKTSTGKESVNATLPVGLVMARAIRDHFDETGYRIGFKPAGGLRTAKAARVWLTLMREELGRNWQDSTYFRLGASTLLNDLERQLEYYATNRYSAEHRHGLA